jgi:hypothetical protein
VALINQIQDSNSGSPDREPRNEPAGLREDLVCWLLKAAGGIWGRSSSGRRRSNDDVCGEETPANGGSMAGRGRRIKKGSRRVRGSPGSRRRGRQRRSMAITVGIEKGNRQPAGMSRSCLLFGLTLRVVGMFRLFQVFLSYRVGKVIICSTLWIHVVGNIHSLLYC